MCSCINLNSDWTNGRIVLEMPVVPVVLVVTDDITDSEVAEPTRQTLLHDFIVLLESLVSRADSG